MVKAKNNEHGNAFFIILLGVILFAALMYTFSKSARHGNENLSKKQGDLGTMELLDTAQKMERAVDRLLAKGCSENDISFENDSGTSKMVNGTVFDYTNAGTPADDSCKIFSPNGGVLNPPPLISENLVVDPSLVCVGCLHPQSWWITMSRVTGMGTDAGAAGTDLVLWMGRVTKEQCISINNHLGITNPSGNPPVDVISGMAGIFTGTFVDAVAAGDSIETAELVGKRDFCFDWSGSSDWSYIYMHVLHAR